MRTTAESASKMADKSGSEVSRQLPAVCEKEQKMGHRSKRYLKEAEQVNDTPMPLADAVEKIKSFKSVKFDQSIDCVVNLGIDTKLAEQNIRGSLSLPYGIGKQKKVIAFCDDADAEAAKAAGAIEAGSDDLIKKINDGWMDFDVAIASPKGDGQGRKARQSPRAAGQDAKPKERHGYRRCGNSR